MQIKYAFLEGGKKQPMKKSLPAFAPSPIVVTVVGIIWGLISFYFGIIYGMPLLGEEQTVIASNPSTTVAQDSASPIAEKEAPEWVLGVEEMLKPSAELTSLFYVVLDIILLVFSGTLVLTFWGGQFSRTWLAVTIPALLIYIADVRYAYVAARGNFETGGVLDTLWVFSAILFGIGAALEYDLSISLRCRRN